MARYYKDKLYSDPERYIISRAVEEKLSKIPIKTVKERLTFEKAKQAATALAFQHSQKNDKL